jgi:N-acetylglutamate synthase-like GNAT family acetyltransferase
MVIREAGGSDILALVDILRSSFREVAERFGLTIENCPKSLAFCTRERIEDDFERGLMYFILEDDGGACGCVAMERAGAEVCYLQRLAVLPENRRRGFGETLVHHIFDRAGRMGIRRIEIGIISKQTELKNWYKKVGFVEKGTKKFDHLPFLVAFMFKEL